MLSYCPIHGRFLGYYDRISGFNCGVWCRNDERGVLPPTHWMPLPEQGRKDAMEVLFEDHSDSPYCLHTGMEQWDMVPSRKEAGDQWRLAVWTRAGKQLEMKCYYRLVDRIPCMRGV